MSVRDPATGETRTEEVAAEEVTDTDARYLQQALPVLVSYTQQVMAGVDVERLHQVAERADVPDSTRAFVAAARDFRTAVAQIEGRIE